MTTAHYTTHRPAVRHPPHASFTPNLDEINNFPILIIKSCYYKYQCQADLNLNSHHC